jgi:uncharacterized membrane protein YfcA
LSYGSDQADDGLVGPEILFGALLIGAGVGLLSGAFGKGGSSVATPLLAGIGVPAMVALASPLPAIIPSSGLASRRYARAGHLDRRVLRIALLVGLPATAIGAFLTQWIPGGSLIIVTDIVILALGVRMLCSAPDHDVDDDPPPARAIVVVGISLIVGFVSGVLGNGGGFLLVPLFTTVLGMPLRRALGTSLACAAVFAIPGTIVHAALGHIDWSLTLAFAFASLPMATVGARLALGIKQRSLHLAYGIGLASLATGLLLFAH